MSLSRRSVWLAAAVTVAMAAGALPARAVAGNEVPDGVYRFTAKVTDGSSRACTGTLINAQWILTARECVASPAGPVTAVIGKTDLSSAAGHERAVLRTVAHPTLNLALLRFSVPVTDIAVPAVRTSPPAAGEELALVGYGRTATQWVPSRLHSVKAKVTTVGAQSADVESATAGASTTCKGDAGGPAIRESGGAVELVGVHGASWQGGCLGETETRTGAVEVRVDVAADWIAATVRERPRTDFSDDVKADIAGIDANNDIKLYTGNGAGQVTGGTAMTAGSGLWRNFHGISAGDFNGDGFADIAGIDANNDMKLYTGNGAGRLAGGTAMLAGSGLWAGFRGFVAADFTGDGKVDIAGIDAADNMKLYVGDGAGKVSGGTAMTGGSGLWAGFKDFVAADFNADGKVDIAGIDAANNMKLYFGTGAGKLTGEMLMWATGGLWTGFGDLTAGDFNGDGKADIAGIDKNKDLRLYTGNGAGQLSGGSAMWPTGGLWAGFHGIA